MTRNGRILILQLSQIEEELEALKQIFKDELQLELESGTHYMSVQYPTKDSATAWDWFTDFVANKCISIKYFLSDNQCFAPQHALDTAPKDVDSARVKLKQAKAFSNGMKNVTTLICATHPTSLDVFDALRDQLDELAMVDLEAHQEALLRIERIHYAINQMHRTLQTMHRRYRDFLVSYYIDRLALEDS